MARWSFSGQGSSSAPSSDADVEVDDMEAAIRRRRPIKPGLLGTRTQRPRKFTHWGRNLSTRPDKLLAAWVVLITVSSFRIQPHLQESFRARPWGYVFPLAALAGLIGIRVLTGKQNGLAAFLCSCLFILAMLTSAAFGLYPYVLPSNADRAFSLTIHNAAAAPYGLGIGLMWFIPGMLLTAVYFTYTYRNFSGKVKV
jgi:cytochrome d ubiquinol oxidase subunit II